MCDLQIAKVEEIAFATSHPLQSNQIGKRADRCLRAVHPADFRSHQQLLEAEWGRTLSQEIEIPMRR